MVFRNIRFAIRQLIRNKVFSIINILGLSLALLACISILKYVAYERSFDDFHKDTAAIYRLSVSYTNIAGVYGEYAGLSSALGPKLEEDIPEVLESVRVFPLRETMRHTIVSATDDPSAGKFDIPEILAVDRAAFNLFTFEIVNGNREGFSSELPSVAISETTASKLFGLNDPIGKAINVNRRIDLVVSSVFKDWPDNSHLHPEIVMQIDFVEEMDIMRPMLHFLGEDNAYTYVKLTENANLYELAVKLEGFVKGNIREQDYADAVLNIMPFDKIHLQSSGLIADMAETKSEKTLDILVLLAALILLMAWFNYVNLITSGSFQRSKEVAIRRIHGASPHLMFFRLLIETCLLVSLVFALVLTANQFLDNQLSQIVGKGALSDLLGNPELFYGLIGAMLTGILFSAAYPTLLLSRFRTSELIKGKLGSSGRSNVLKRIIVVTQYAITIGLVFGTLTVIRQVLYLKSIETKMALEQVLVLKGPGVRNPEFSHFRDGIKLLRSELESVPGIESVSTSNFVPGFKLDYTANLKNPLVHDTKPNYVRRIFADEAFTDVYDIEVVAGRFFDKAAEYPIEERPIVVNESAARELGFDPVGDIVGKSVQYWNDPIKVIGLVEDFRMESADQPIESMFFFPTLDTKYFSMKLSTTRPDELTSLIEEKWNRVYPGNPFNMFYSQEHFNRQYGAFDQFEKQLLLLTVLSISVACLGLFALAFDTARTRVKEVGIRKVLGARVFNIMYLFIGNYAKLIMVSAILTTPLVYYIMTNWLDDYANRIAISFDLLIYPTIGVLLMAVLVITMHTLKIAQANPVESLRQD